MSKDPIAGLAEGLAALRQERQKDAVQAIPQASRVKMPPRLTAEAARLQYEFWARHEAEIKKIQMRPFNQIPTDYERRWLEITHIVQELTVTVVLWDAMEFLEQSNGDLGAAIAKGLRRYARDVLNFEISQ
jgi:predicted TIM-barrel fold metal-dependent hydrolase